MMRAHNALLVCMSVSFESLMNGCVLLSFESRRCTFSVVNSVRKRHLDLVASLKRDGSRSIKINMTGETRIFTFITLQSSRPNKLCQSQHRREETRPWQDWFDLEVLVPVASLLPVWRRHLRSAPTGHWFYLKSRTHQLGRGPAAHGMWSVSFSQVRSSRTLGL